MIKEKNGEECKEWLKKEMKAFNKFVHEKKEGTPTQGTKPRTKILL
ncbi:MAG: hypothetical protein KUA33_05970 [Methanobacterium sp.]|nr:hypothetical protein [Methanobacterium sp.]